MKKVVKILTFFAFIANYLLGQTVDGNSLINNRGKAIYEIVFFGSEQQSWDYAKGQAELAGGHLATITSGDETALIQELYSVVGNGSELFIGGYRNNGAWSWVNDEGDFDSFNQLEPYANWEANEPNSLGEQYATIGRFGDGRWNDSNMPLDMS